MTSSINQQILQAVENDPDAIRALAGAVAQGDAAAIRGMLAARGIDLSAADAGALLATARGASANTNTNTNTNT